MSDEFDTLVPDPQVARELCVTLMTLWRWDRDPAMQAIGWPPPIKAGQAKQSRKSRFRRQLEKFKANLVRRALVERQGVKRGVAS